MAICATCLVSLAVSLSHIVWPVVRAVLWIIGARVLLPLRSWRVFSFALALVQPSWNAVYAVTSTVAGRVPNQTEANHRHLCARFSKLDVTPPGGARAHLTEPA